MRTFWKKCSRTPNYYTTSRVVVDLIANWRTNSSNLTTVNLLQAIADSKFVSPSSQQKLLNSGVSKENHIKDISSTMEGNQIAHV